ncbi:MAG: hypothetical protein H0U53_01050 [Actinobacteria bacterium]|nr:hypothetical protein [Actinomycetota bacterium]
MSETTEAPAFLRGIADEVTSAIRDQRNSDVRRHFSLIMRVAVSEKKMRKVWDDVVQMYGAPLDAKHLREKRRGRFWVFDRFIDFENGRTLLSITLNKRGRIYGLFLIPVTVPGEAPSPDIS